ncbi:MAG: VWA domain-containing protein [Pyrinomonadaceae bacterium]|nr:VWA domain-containing protein [Pyrinomonadaceae bacterium]
MKRITILFSICLLLFASLEVCAQTPAPAPTPPQGVQPADEDAVVRITTNLIQVDAVVTDSKGRIVTSLKPEDFELLVNGKPQTITNFSLVTTEAAAVEQPVATADRSRDKNVPPVPAARIRPEQVKRTIALVVDDLTMAFCNVYYVRKSLKKFVDEQMQPGDLVAIVRVGNGIGALQQFTSDKQQLYAAIENIKYNMIVGRRCTFDPLGSESGSGRGSNLAEPGQIMVDSAEVAKIQEDLLVSSSLATINYVVRGMRGLPGRKAVMLLSEGFVRFDKGNSDRSRRIREAIERLVDSSNRSGVVLYAMDVRGLVTLGLNAEDDINPAPSAMGVANPTPASLIARSMSPAQIQNSLQARRNLILDTQDGMRYIAEQTGGLAFYDNNDISAGIKKALDDQKTYYLLGFQPDSSTFDQTQARFNHLTVKVKAPGLKVRYRSGFFGIKDEQASTVAKTPQQQLMRALTSPFASDDISLRLTPIFGNDARAGSYVRSLVHISTKGLTFTEKPGGMREAVINIVAYTFGDNGIVTNSVGATHTITLSEQLYKRALTSGLVYSLNVPIKKAGPYQLRVAVRDDKSEKVGSASQFINIPDLKKNSLTLSGIALTGFDAKDVKAMTAAAGSEASNAETSGMLTQAALRRFRAGQILQYAYAIYNAKTGKGGSAPQLTTQIKLYRDGKEIFAGQQTSYDAKGQQDLTRLVAEGSLQLGGLQEGEYVLQIIVTDLGASGKNRTTTNWIDFEIVK